MVFNVVRFVFVILCVCMKLWCCLLFLKICGVLFCFRVFWKSEVILVYGVFCGIFGL